MDRLPTYLRVVVTARCSLACSYCHLEGDPATAAAGGLPGETLAGLLALAVDQGVKKLKFLGGEPLLRADLPQQIGRLRERAPALDISLVTGGAADPARLDACFERGLSRANLSIHGWSSAAFRERTGRGAEAMALRQRNLERLLARGRFLKLNFVWRGERDDEDLNALLDWAASRPVVVAVLNDLGQAELTPAEVIAALVRLRGVSACNAVDDDPHSLPTLRLGWADGLAVEVKDHALGQVAPWGACAGCPVRVRCREGIFALRLSHDGRLRPCMDRPELGVDLRGALGEGRAQALWAEAVRGWQRRASLPREAA